MLRKVERRRGKCRIDQISQRQNHRDQSTLHIYIISVNFQRLRYRCLPRCRSLGIAYSTSRPWEDSSSTPSAGPKYCLSLTVISVTVWRVGASPERAWA